MNGDLGLTCFKAYDVRGKIGEELNDEIAYRIGRAVAQTFNAKTVALGFDARKHRLFWQKLLRKASVKPVLMSWK